MTTAAITDLIALLSQAKEKGCNYIKLQLYDDWQQVEKEQKHPTAPLDEYKIDTRFYNTIEFETETKNLVATEKIITKMEGDILIIKVEISDMESLMKNLNIEPFFK